MSLGMEVGLGPGDFVLDGHPAPPPPPQRGGGQSPSLLRPNGWMDETGTWHGGRRQPRQLCVPVPFPQKGKTPLGTEVDIGAGHIVLDGFPALRERGTAPCPSFRPMSIVATVAHLSYC